MRVRGYGTGGGRGGTRDGYRLEVQLGPWGTGVLRVVLNVITVILRVKK